MTIISTQKLRECQDFVDKVSENRFNKVKQRQINKLNLLTTRKEGNITRSNTNPNNYNHNHNHNNHNSQVNSQVISQAPPREDNRSSQVGPPHREASASPAPLHASSQAGEGGALPRAGTTPTPPREDASLSQVSTPLPPFPPILLLSCLHWKTGDFLTSLTPKQAKPTIQLIILGKVAGNPQGKAPPGLPGGAYYLPGRQ